MIPLEKSIRAHDNEGTKSYPVKKIPEDIALTGKADHPLWKNALTLSDFSYPWETDIPQATKFKALHSEDWLYCFFDVTDKDILIHINKNDKTEVAASSRAEIFFKTDDQLSPYYCLEIDPLARVFDYKGEFHRRFDTKWTWPAGHLLVKSNRRMDGYTLEIAISKGSLKELGILKDDNSIQAGLYRGDCLEINKNGGKFRWISWVQPDSQTPDFHIPSSFGILKLE